METVRKFRLWVVRASIVLTLLIAGLAYPFSLVAAQGVALGGLGGILVFWILAIRMEKLAKAAPKSVNFLSVQWTAIRMGIYALVLWKAYTLDPVVGLLAAVGGLFIYKVVVVFLAFTGLDLKQENK